MAAPKIKKKSGTKGSKTSPKASLMPRQGAIPCLVLLVLVLVIIGLLMFFALRSTA
jgi:hypothetical protein